MKEGKQIKQMPKPFIQRRRGGREGGEIVTDNKAGKREKEKRERGSRMKSKDTSCFLVKHEFTRKKKRKERRSALCAVHRARG